MTTEEQVRQVPPVSKWQCTICRATVEIIIGPPLKQHTFYPADTGPYADRQLPHICPVQAGLLPQDLEAHPNATRVE